LVNWETRTGIFLMGGTPAAVTCRDSSTTSLVGFAQQAKMNPACASSSLSALA